MSTLVLVAALKARPGQEDRLGAALEGMVGPSLAEPGCLAYRPYVDPRDPAAYVIVEAWTGPEALELHFSTPHFLEIAQRLPDLVGEPLTVRLLSNADVRLPDALEELRLT